MQTSQQEEASVSEEQEIQEDDKASEQEAKSEQELKIEDLEHQVSDLNERLLRVQADYDNFRRRTKQAKEQEAKYRSQTFLEKLLPVVDNFDRAIQTTPETEEAKNLLEGLDIVYRQLHEALNGEGVKQIETVGQPFDPHVHQAVMQVESDEYDSNVVVEELQTGYQLHDRVIRPAMVKVNT
nr:nucleotide exchange factor GrpE [Texcoconibacillus texcoconensis]